MFWRHDEAELAHLHPQVVGSNVYPAEHPGKAIHSQVHVFWFHLCKLVQTPVQGGCTATHPQVEG